MPHYLAPQDGSFEYTAAADGSGCYVVTQTTPMQPIFWHPKSSHDTRFPYAVLGSSAMTTDYKVSASVCFTGSGQSGGIIARFSSQGNQIFNFRGYILDLGSAGGWWLSKNSMSAGNTVLAHGTIAAPAIGKWTPLAIAAHETTITAWVNGHPGGDRNGQRPELRHRHRRDRDRRVPWHLVSHSVQGVLGDFLLRFLTKVDLVIGTVSHPCQRYRRSAKERPGGRSAVGQMSRPAFAFGTLTPVAGYGCGVRTMRWLVLAAWAHACST